MDEFSKQCFFCSKTIDGKKSREHVISNSLLGKLGIKEKTVTGIREVEYSRVKVPAHPSCNNEFGSQYEKRVLELLDDTDALYEALNDEAKSSDIVYMPADSPAAIITTWLSKIYYGLFYYDHLTAKDEAWKEVCKSILNDINFDYVRTSYEYGHGFQLPSSLYVFKTDNTNTDLVTIVDPSTILLKINSLTIILCICDGYLTKNYLFGKDLERLKNHVYEEDKNNIEFPSYKLALGEILALRACIPKTPKFICGKTQITNMSLCTMVANPDEYYKIDKEELINARKEIYHLLNIAFECNT